MIEFLKYLYESLYEIPSIYLGIKENYYSHLFTILIIIIFFSIIILLIKQIKEYLKLKKENKKIQRNIDKNLVNFFNTKFDSYDNKN